MTSIESVQAEVDQAWGQLSDEDRADWLDYKAWQENANQQYGDPEECWCCIGESRGRHCEHCHS